MAAKLQNPPEPSISFSAQPQALPRVVDFAVPVRGVAHVPQISISSQQSNPFRTPKHSPHTSESYSYQAFSPISPIQEEDQNNRSRQTRQPQSAKMTERKSVDLRTLDGKPYVGHEGGNDKSRKVKVAQDMYSGDMPPGYEQKDYQGPLAPKEKEGHSHTGPCHKCGGHKKDPSDGAAVMPEKPQQPQNIDCNKCGGKRSMPPSSFPRGAVANMTARAAPRAAPVQSSPAGPSSAPNGHKHSCTKCGRRKRPESASTTGSSSQAQSPIQAGLSFQKIPHIQTNGVPMFNVEPPTAITERAPTLPFSPASTVGETPLIAHGQQSGDRKARKPSRSSSISSLFRSLSRRKKSNDNPLPSQQLAKNGEQGSYADKISHAMRDSQDASYARLGPDNRIERPGSPFSFIDKPQEDQTFEMNDIRKSKQPERRNSWDKADESTTFLSNVPAQRPQSRRSQSTSAVLNTDQQDDVFLALPPDQRPGVTRFKSLRSGVSRAAGGLSRSASQISRSNSLRRLESVKRVPQFWYRDDMAIEGAQGEYNNYAY